MCGLAGMAGGPPPERATLQCMADAMVHRGPDSEGVWHDANAGLASRRLAIIDLEPRSDQPLHLGPWHLAFNGEIYNYRELREELRRLGHEFSTEGDGEVLLHAWSQWEEGSLDRLNGMFALAVWHEDRQELVCARDPFGEKPFFWARSGGGIVFASEVGALLAARPELGPPRADALAPYLGLGWMPAPDESFFAGINQLPGSHFLRFAAGSVKVERYWSPSRVDTPVEYSEAAERLRELLIDSIRLRLRADVPVGTSLSGGVDSSAVVLLSSEIAGDHRRHAFTARFPGFARDEWRYADAVARRAGVVEHHAVEPTPEGLLDELDALVRHQGEPFASTSIYAQWRVMKVAQAAGVTVLLDGQGADEFLGGYPGLNGWTLRSQGIGAVLGGLVSEADREPTLRALGSGWIPGPVRRWDTRRRVSAYVTPAVVETSAGVVPPPVERMNGLGNPLARELLRQTFFTSLPMLLRYADRNSMAHSREVRLPFLDRRVAEYALSLPARFLYRDGMTKMVLRDAVRDLAPAEVLARRDKVGFETPQQQWLREPAFIDRVVDVLLDPAARQRGLYRTDAIEADSRAGDWRDTDGIWRALNLELWLRAFEHA
jgi:asparagine synthase (glutamine-hydrolysing)